MKWLSLLCAVLALVNFGFLIAGATQGDIYWHSLISGVMCTFVAGQTWDAA